jgi:hypothetical protein
VLGNPRATIPIDYDVSEFPGAAGVYIEVSGVNREFMDPNGTQPDPTHTAGGSQRGVRGRLFVMPAQNLPAGWGTYSFRVIPLNAAGNQAVGRFSSSSRLIMRR